MSTKHKSINPDTIDFSATQCMGLTMTESIDWINNYGNVEASILVPTVLKWIEANNLHVPEDMLPHECDSLKWLDDNFESATRDYFMDVYAEESEVHCG